MSQRSPAHNIIVQIKVKLLGVTKPPVWRQVQLRADTRLDQLHEILQAALGWENYHMHVFSFGEEGFGVPDPELGFIDERKVTLGELTDLGAALRLHLRLRRRLGARDPRRGPARPRPRHPLPDPGGGKGACPPEDCGGAWGYADLKEILADPNDDEHQERLEWLGLDHASEFDPAALPTEDIDYELALSGAGR